MNDKCKTSSCENNARSYDVFCESCRKTVDASNKDRDVGYLRTPRSPGFHSNARITWRNGGITHQFLNDIGGCSANYR